MILLSWLLVASPILLAGYAYVGYPLALRVLCRRRHGPEVGGTGSPEPEAWPLVSITVPVYNEEAQIRGTLESLLTIDYPADRRQILVISDASTDTTDAIVAEYADRGVELLRLPERGGKGAAERAAVEHLRGDIVVNTDASIRILPDSLKHLVRQFADPGVGLASGRDISVDALAETANAGEGGYVGYEMEIRSLETRVAGIVGASGCFYAIRSALHQAPLPPSLSRDFAAALITRENGFRAVSVDAATCLVPRTTSLQREYKRKVRTITRGIETLAHKRHLLNPFRYGLFAWMLFSHKVCRWLVPWSLPLAFVGLVMMSARSGWARVALVLGVLALAWAAAGWFLADRRRLPRLAALPAFVLAGNVAALHAGWRALRGDDDAVWEPTRRHVVQA